MSQYLLNPDARAVRNYRGLFGDEEYALVDQFLGARPHFTATPLLQLRALASEIGIADILVKDESSRLGVNSFKVLGVSYAVAQLLRQGRLARNSVVVCASEGNHGRAVAHVAAENNLKARIYVASATSRVRIEVIENEGAEVTVVDGNYDDAVKQAALDAKLYGWQVISDTSWSGYEEIPRWIMSGYTQLMKEAETQWMPDAPPDVVFVQAGVGGLACAVLSWLCRRYETKRPFVIVCEPVSAACVLESCRAGEPVTLGGPFNTIMVGLRCGQVSPLTWPVISKSADAFVSIDDEQCASAMRALTDCTKDDPIVRTGAAGACGLATLLAVGQEDKLLRVRKASGLNPNSRALVIITEGVTDPSLYAKVIGTAI